MVQPSGFLSTPSARRATLFTRHLAAGQHISIHALREEGDDGRLASVNAQNISIHALREEGDFFRGIVRGGRLISIHALREEGDSKNRDKISIFK